ncbi:HRD1-like protein [Guillardia theta CCMP2712]|uniref:RING-type E3 ubiquitin transferase n=1 Tax=Guillardia theta (strain CCMP2712) TaxID=905079 RepID=L1I6T6_GUITC|nr:HRD1-like protein [Guillardia theta CCMP2712]EKX31973.1 HRD1-like protein [Guillardia theta CCMP2712]|eukprot:XP_005818953.1 HRD1-like protein [Guillardia theta CCMP2712]
MISVRTYCLFSILATVACITHAVQVRKQFYPIVVHLGTNKLCVTVMGNMVFVAALIFAQFVRKIFLGSLRPTEELRLYEKIWFAVTETCLALTIFREELKFRFVFLFTVLLFVKVFHWLSQFRVEHFHTELAVSTLTHIRILMLMGILFTTDCFFFVWQAKTLLLEGPSFLILFAFEYVILASTITTTFLKYMLYVIDMRRHGRWSNKAVYSFYLNLISDLFQLFVYLIFFSIVLSFYGIPLHIVRDLYNTFGNFKKRIADFIRYRRVIVNMNTRFPNATAEELSRMDHTCIICREEMQPPHAKKLPCGHIFHFDCLRSWLEEHSQCPTCRMQVEIDNAQPVPAQAEEAAGEREVQNQRQEQVRESERRRC